MYYLYLSVTQHNLLHNEYVCSRALQAALQAPLYKHRCYLIYILLHINTWYYQSFGIIYIQHTIYTNVRQWPTAGFIYL